MIRFRPAMKLAHQLAIFPFLVSLAAAQEPVDTAASPVAGFQEFGIEVKQIDIPNGHPAVRDDGGDRTVTKDYAHGYYSASNSKTTLFKRTLLLSADNSLAAEFDLPLK